MHPENFLLIEFRIWIHETGLQIIIWKGCWALPCTLAWPRQQVQLSAGQKIQQSRWGKLATWKSLGRNIFMKIVLIVIYDNFYMFTKFYVIICLFHSLKQCLTLQKRYLSNSLPLKNATLDIQAGQSTPGYNCYSEQPISWTFPGSTFPRTTSSLQVSITKCTLRKLSFWNSGQHIWINSCSIKTLFCNQHNILLRP